MFITLYFFSIYLSLYYIYKQLISLKLENLFVKNWIKRILIPVDPSVRYLELPFITSKLLNITKDGSKILDISSNKLVAFFLAARKSNILIYAIDLFEKEILEWRKLTGNKYNSVKLEKADCLNLPYKKNSFDIIYSICVFDHLPGDHDDIKALSEVFRVLKRKGVFIISLPMSADDEIIYHGKDVYELNRKVKKGKVFFGRKYTLSRLNNHFANSSKFNLLQQKFIVTRSEKLVPVLLHPITNLLLWPVIPFLAHLNYYLSDTPPEKYGSAIIILQKK